LCYWQRINGYFHQQGGLLITFKLDGTRFAFISCHLTAHEGVEHCEQRNVSISEILGGVRAGDKNIDITEQFHHVFWMGDMNYRLTFDTRTPKDSKKNIGIMTESNSKVIPHHNAQKSEDIKVELNDKKAAGEGGKEGGEMIMNDDDESSDDEGTEIVSDKKREW
jgi:hypothetical protein